MDTVQITYKYSGDELLEAWSYVNLYTTGINFLQKSIITYNNGNQFENSTWTALNGSSLQSRCVAFDQKKNFFRTLSKLNYVFIGSAFPSGTRSVNNPIKVEGYNGPTEYIWTYNKDGYPLTMQEKGKNYLAAEFTYNK